ncbi:MAG: rRNA adenine N-6-methyltransferase family protein [Endozoicomonas sp.]
MEKGIIQLAFIQLFHRWREGAAVLVAFGLKRRFILPWLWLKLSYLLDGPYAVSRRYYRKTGVSDIYRYGETPLTTLNEIAARVGISDKDCVFELGAGSGFTSLWLNTVKNCRVTAIEQAPLFCWRLERLVRRFRLTGINVMCCDYLNTSLEGASVIYLYASNLDEATITELAVRLFELGAGIRIITVSYSLQPYLETSGRSGSFQLLDQFSVPFEWGEAEVYVQMLTGK